MFDGPLAGDAVNVHFPTNVHLTGCAGRGNGNPASNLQGTIDSTASGYFEGKYTMVWNFLPSQANVVIAALAFTHAKDEATPFHMYRRNAWNTISNGYRHFVVMDYASDTAYFSYNYQANSTINFYKRKLSSHLLRVNTPFLGAEETAASYFLSTETITDRNYWDISPDYDGYVYLCATQGNQGGSATVYLRRLKASADRFSFVGGHGVPADADAPGDLPVPIKRQQELPLAGARRG